MASGGVNMSDGKDLVPGRMGRHVKVGASVPKGLAGCRLLQDLRLGNIMLTLLPLDKSEALAVANYCRENQIYFLFSELLWRGTFDLCWAAREKVPRDRFYSKADLEELFAAGGRYFLGRIAIGEIGGLLYGPKSYWVNRAAGDWESLPAAETVDQAKRFYLDEIRKYLDFERRELGESPLFDVDAGCTFKYHLEAGVDIPLLEAMPGDCTTLTAAIRGAAKAYWPRFWGIHIAMAAYGGVAVDAMWLKRFRISLYSAFMSGSDFVYPESGHLTYPDQAGKAYAFDSPEMKETRRILRECNQFAQVHSRPAAGPRVTLGFVYGNLDGYPGLWNKYVWGQSGSDKWLFGPAEWGWDYLDHVYRKGRWDDENIQGDLDFYGQPPYGQYDVVPIEAPLEVLNTYTCLFFLGWNTMTAEIYEKLKAYVSAGGRLVMSVPHLSTETDRGKDLALYNGGDFRDLFGVVVKGKGKSGVAGLKTFNHSTVPSYKMPVWRIRTDPRFMGFLDMAQTEVHGARVISGWSDFYFEDERKLLESPVLTEFTLGKGTAFLLNSWTYPGDRGWSDYVRQLMRIVCSGEQGEIRVIAGDSIRYAVYDGPAPGAPDSSPPVSAIYLLNTEYDTPQCVRLWINGRTCPPIMVGPAEMNVAYSHRGIVLAPDDRGVEIERWDVKQAAHAVGLFCRMDMTVRVFNISDSDQTVEIDGNGVSLATGAEGCVSLAKRADPERAEFYDADFLSESDEPREIGGLPY
jgi:hypothetical protein